MGDLTKLRALLLGLWLLLLLPALLLGYQTYQRLQFESLHQYRTLAETLSDGVASNLALALQQEAARDPGAYNFQQGANRSPLAALAPSSSLPGVVGYFQVDAQGVLSSPVMPVGPQAAQLSVEDLTLRQLQLQRIETALLQELPQDAQAQTPVASTQAAEDVEALADAVGAVSAKSQRNQVLYESLSKTDEVRAEQRKQQTSAAVGELKLDTDYFNQASKRLGSASAFKSAQDKAAVQRRAAAPKAKLQRSAEVAAVPPAPDTKVSASLFGSTVTEFALRPLSASHLLLFRRVWQAEQPLVQGLVLDRAQFFAGAFAEPYQASALAQVSDLAVAVDDQVQLTLAAGSEGDSAGAKLSGGELLYRRYLSSPLGNLELLFSARELPLATGASLVVWTLLVLLGLLCAGFALLYVLGKRQLQQRQQQQDFVSAVSHELKTPLTSIRMYGEMLKSGWVDEAKKTEYYDYIFNESERLSRLINNVLQLSRITRGRDELQLGSLSVAQILDLVRSRAAAQVQAQGYSLTIRCEAGLEAQPLIVDEDAMLQVMINLIDNGLKFSQGCERRELLLEVARDGDGVAFRLRDFGPGIEPGQLNKIFELFYRSENELTRETVGTGIGLALVQEQVEAMGGRIRAHNREPGAEFVVRLPT